MDFKILGEIDQGETIAAGSFGNSRVFVSVMGAVGGESARDMLKCD
jgi:hypothetical protein